MVGPSAFGNWYAYISVLWNIEKRSWVVHIGDFPQMTDSRFHSDGLVQDCSISIANTLEPLTSCGNSHGQGTLSNEMPWRDPNAMSLQTQTIAVTSKWARWRLKSPASRLFTQPFIQTKIKENIKAPRHWPLCGEFTGDRWIPRTNGQ